MRDPQLDLFKRNLKTEINNVLPERYVQEIIVFEFARCSSDKAHVTDDLLKPEEIEALLKAAGGGSMREGAARPGGGLQASES